MPYLNLIPAYGRDYRSKAAVLADWNAGNDFKIEDVSSPHDGRYVNKADTEKYPDLAGLTLTVRYANLTRVTTIKVPAGDDPKTEPA
jgi:hypothetical protein